MTEYYTTYEIVNLLPNYSSSKALLKALHDNQKLNKGKIVTSSSRSQYILSAIWESRLKLSKRWFYRKKDIDKIINRIL